jgi:hypothetical protein
MYRLVPKITEPHQAGAMSLYIDTSLSFKFIGGTDNFGGDVENFDLDFWSRSSRFHVVALEEARHLLPSLCMLRPTNSSESVLRVLE